MKRKEVLEKRAARLKKKLGELLQRSEASQDVEEVKSIHTRMQEIQEDLKETEEELESLEEENNTGEETEGDQGNSGEARNAMAGNLEQRGQNMLASYGMQRNGQRQGTDDPLDTEEYRSAFMEFVCRGVPIPEELRAAELPKEFREAQVTTTEGASAVIPTTILGEIIKKMDTYGNVWSKVRKLNIQGGIKIPILSMKPVAKWIGENEVSEYQRITSDDSISFNYYGLECRIAQTILANVTTLKMFQDLFITLATEAMIKALEIAIFKGEGTASPTGILKDTRIPEENKIKLSEEDIKSWSAWKKKVFGKMKKSYRKGEFFFNQETFDGYIDGMTDTSGQPIGRVNYGIEGAERYRFGGKTVETVEDVLLKSWDATEGGEVFGIFADLSNYAINTNMQMVTVRWTDHETNQVKDKCLMIVDGKLVDPYGALLLIKDTTGAAVTAARKAGAK